MLMLMLMRWDEMRGEGGREGERERRGGIGEEGLERRDWRGVKARAFDKRSVLFCSVLFYSIISYHIISYPILISYDTNPPHPYLP